MATKTLYLLDAAASGSSHGSLQDGGTAPSVATTATGWTPGLTASANYSEMLYATKRLATTFATTVLPNTTPSTTDCWRTQGRYSGRFASGGWSMKMSLIGSTATMSGTGNLRVRVYRSGNPTGTSAVDITGLSGTVAFTSAANLSTSVAQITTATWNPGLNALDLHDEFLFFQFAWDITVASGSSSAGVVFRQDGTNSLIITPDFESWPPTWVDSDLPRVGKPNRRPDPEEYRSWEESPPAASFVKEFQQWSIEPVIGRENRRPAPTEYDAWESSSPQISKAVPVPRLWLPTRARPKVFDDLAPFTAPQAPPPVLAEFEQWSVEPVVGKEPKPVPRDEAWESSSPQISQAVPVPRLYRPRPTPRLSFDDTFYAPPGTFTPPAVSEFEQWVVDAIVGKPNRKTTQSELEAFSPSPPQPTEYQAWTVDAVVGRPNRRPAPTEYESWEPSSPQPARFQLWAVDVAVGRPNRRPAPTEYESWESSSPQPTEYQEWLEQSLVGRPNRRPAPTEYESWEPSSPQPATFQTWTVDALVGKAPRKRPPWEPEAWLSSSPQPTEFVEWHIVPLTGQRLYLRAPRVENEEVLDDVTPLTAPTSWVFWTNDTVPPRYKLRPPDPEVWPSRGFAPEPFLQWAVDAVVGRPNRRPAPSEYASWEESSPQPSRYLAWIIDAVVGKANRRPAPTEYESWESSSPEIAHYVDWSIAAALGRASRRVATDEPWTSAVLVVSHFQDWVQLSPPGRTNRRLLEASFDLPRIAAAPTLSGAIDFVEALRPQRVFRRIDPDVFIGAPFVSIAPSRPGGSTRGYVVVQTASGIVVRPATGPEEAPRTSSAQGTTQATSSQSSSRTPSTGGPSSSRKPSTG